MAVVALNPRCVPVVWGPGFQLTDKRSTNSDRTFASLVLQLVCHSLIMAVFVVLIFFVICFRGCSGSLSSCKIAINDE